jgi:hypothetical protein
MTTIPTAIEAKLLSIHDVLPEKVVIGIKNAISNHQLSTRIYTSDLSDGNILFLQNKGYVCKYNKGIRHPRYPRIDYQDDYTYLDISWGH